MNAPASRTRPPQSATSDAAADLRLVERAVGGDAVSLRALVGRFSPVIHFRVARALTLRARFGRSSRQEVEDLVQEVFASLLDDGGRALRAWDPGRKLTLDGFVGLLAEHRVASILRSRRRNPWTETPRDARTLSRPSGAAHDDLERRTAERDFLDRLLARLEPELGESGMELLSTLILSGASIDEVSASTGMSKGALYTWKSRTCKRAREIARRLLAE